MNEAKLRCGKKESTPKLIYKNTYSSTWKISLADAKTLFLDLYEKPERLGGRAFFDPDRNQFFLPFNQSEKQKLIPLTENFLTNLIFHIEEALDKKYADIISFMDMGHSHFFLPKALFEERIKKVPVDAIWTLYEEMLAHKDVRFFYHTAEQFKTAERTSEGIFVTESSYLKHRYETRNVLGDNKPSGKLEIIQMEDMKNTFNTRNNLPGYIFWGAGYYMESNKNGCFPYKKGEDVFYFDLSLDFI